MTSIIDIEQLITKLQPAKCDYWVKNENKKSFGLTITQTLELVLQSVSESEEGWGEAQQPHFEQLVNRLQYIESQRLRRG